MRSFMFAVEVAAVAALLGAGLASGTAGASGGVDDSYLAIDHGLQSVALDQAHETEDEDIIYECTAYFTACDPPDDDSCFYTGRDPNEEVARMEALNECKFDNPRRGRYCTVEEECEEISRPDPE